jgi:hypothetical protein
VLDEGSSRGQVQPLSVDGIPLGRINFVDLYSVLRDDCNGKIGLLDWYNGASRLPSIPLVNEIPFTEEIGKLVLERNDTDAFLRKRAKKT